MILNFELLPPGQVGKNKGTRKDALGFRIKKERGNNGK
jgi:hypothetical protein